MVYIFLFLLLYFFLALKRLDFALMLLIFLLPSYQVRFEIFGLPSTLLETMILVCFGIWLLRDFHALQKRISQAWQKKRQAHRYPFDLEIVGVVFISWLGIIAAGFSLAALGIWRAYFFEPILVFLMIYNVLGGNNTNPQKTGDLIKESIVKKIMWPLTFSVLAVSVVAILQKVGLVPSPENFWPRVTGVWTYPNALGLYVGPLVPLLLSFLCLEILKFKLQISKQFQTIKILILSLAFLLSLVGLFLASSEGAMIGVLVALAVMFLFWLADKFKKKVFYYFNYFVISIILIFVFFSSLVFLFVVPEHKYFNSNSGTVNYITDKSMLKDFSGEVRKQQWRETFSMLSDDGRWLWGAGLSNFKNKVKPYHQEGIFFNKERDEEFRQKIVWWDAQYKAEHWRPVEIYMYPHNILLNFWTELGVIGTALFIWIVGKFIIYCIKHLVYSTKKEKYFVLGLFGAMIVFVVHGLVDVPYFKNDLSVMFWIFVALLGIATINDKEIKNE